MIARLEEQKAFYASNGRYRDEERRREMLALFDRAIAELRRRGGD